MQYLMSYLKRIFDYRGRSQRAELVAAIFCNLILAVIETISLISFIFSDGLGGIVAILSILFGLLTIYLSLASISCVVRRYHDIGKPGYYFFLGCIPVLNLYGLYLLYFVDSQPGPNMYGPNPKEDNSSFGGGSGFAFGGGNPINGQFQGQFQQGQQGQQNFSQGYGQQQNAYGQQSSSQGYNNANQYNWGQNAYGQQPSQSYDAFGQTQQNPYGQSSTQVFNDINQPRY